MGLFGRKKRLSGLLDGLYDDKGPTDPGMVMDGGYDPSSPTTGAESDPSIGDVGGAPQHKGFNLGRAALGFFGGSGVVSALRQKDAMEFAQKKYAEQEQQTLQNQLAAYQWAKSHGYSEEDAKALAVHPDTVSAMVQANHAPQKFDSGGGSIYQDGGWTTAPRFDGDGNIYAPSQTAPGQQFKVPDLVQRGTKALPLQPGGHVEVVDAINGNSITNGQMQQRAGYTPPPAANEDNTPTVEEGHQYTPGPGGRANPSNWTLLNGGPTGSRSGGFLGGRRRY